MRRFLAVIVVIIVVAVTGVAYAGLQLDFSNSDSEVQNSQTLRIRHISNVVFEGVTIPGEFWVDFVWDQQNWILVPNGNVGQEQLPQCTNGSGTYAYNSTTGELVTTLNGEIKTQVVTLLTSTRLVWEKNPGTDAFIRSHGSAGDILGTWLGIPTTDEGEIGTITFNADGTFCLD